MTEDDPRDTKRASPGEGGASTDRQADADETLAPLDPRLTERSGSPEKLPPTADLGRSGSGDLPPTADVGRSAAGDLPPTADVGRSGSGDLPPTADVGRSASSDVPTAAGPSAAPPAARPEKIGAYAIRGELGRGGMGVVYLAEDPRLGRQIALKVLPERVAVHPEWLARFESEARLLAALNHPNIATIHSLEESAGQHFLTLELIGGVDLADKIVGGLSVEETLAIGRQIASALEAAHRSGVVHLDMKPSNVRVTPDGLVKVLDFGLARALARESDEERALHEQRIMGTPGYMSPEQLGAGEVDHRADLWALGIILFECFSGRRGFERDTVQAAMQATLHEDPDWSLLPSDVPPRLRTTIERALAKSVDVRPSTATEMRRVIEEEVSRVSFASHVREAAPAETRHNLPAHVSTFVGREEEREQVAGALEQRLVTITGFGGSGKTRLAVEIGRQQLDRFGGGVFLVELASIDRDDLVADALASAIGAREEPQRDLSETLVDQLSGARTLLIFDNCEHVLGGCATLTAKLLQSCGELHVMATSREALGLPGEAIHHLRSLSIPGDADLPAPEEIASVPVLALFHDRARSVLPTFELTPATLKVVADICRRLDGIPLAIELAAARAKTMSVPDIAKRLDNRFRLLKGGSRTALPRHQTLQALIDWSYDSLNDDEQAMLRRLSVFAGGWNLEAAEVVGGDEGIEDWEVLDLLTRLVDKSLVEVSLADGDSMRYKMLETVRQYAGERLADSGESESATTRLRTFVLTLAEQARPQLGGAQQGEWIRRLEREHDNVRSALASCIVADAGGETAAIDEGFRIAIALGRFWEVRGHWSEARRLYAELLASADTIDASGRAQIVMASGSLAVRQGDHAEARRLLEQSLAVFRGAGDQDRVALALNLLGMVEGQHGDPARAQQLLEECLEVRRELGDKNGVAATLNNLGGVALVMNQNERAVERLEESLAIRRELGQRHSIAASLGNLGTVLARLRDYARATPLFEESVEIHRETGNKSGVSQSLNNLAHLAHEQEDWAHAVELYSESLEIKRELGDKYGMAVALHERALVRYSVEELAAACPDLEQALELFRALERADVVIKTLDMLATIEAERGNVDRARAHLEEGARMRGDDATGDQLSDALVAWASLAIAVERPEDAAKLFGAAEVSRGTGYMHVYHRRQLDRQLDAVRAALGSGAFERAFEVGRALDRAAAVAVTSQL